MNDLITTLLDVLALLAIAVGLGAGSAHWIGWWGVAVAGAVVAVGSQLASRASRQASGGGG
jgi:hypothetical protein